jgi:hypothetical protein
VARTLLFLFRWGVFAWACVYVWRAFAAAQSTAVLGWITVAHAPDAHDPWWILLVLGLMLLNWGIEARKWALLMKELEPISWRRAFAATLAGCGVSLITPNRTGEFVGRVLFLRPEVRIAAASLTVLGNLSQVLVTLVCGSAGFAMLMLGDRPMPMSGGWLMGAFVTMALLLSLLAAALFLRPGLLRQVIELLPFMRRYDRHFQVLGEQPSSRLLTVLLLSLLRYMVFVTQFAVLLSIFGSAVGILDTLLAIPTIFLLTTLVPTVMLTELGVRAGVAHLILQPLGDATMASAFATSALWAINVLLPAVAGSLILVIVRVRTKAEPR